MKELNLAYIKRFVTKFAKDTDAKVTLDEFFRNGTVAGIKYIKDDVHINVSIRHSAIAKYEVGLACEQAKLNVHYLTDNLNDVVQACDLLIYTAVKLNGTLQLRAVIKASHWGVRLVTVERHDGYRANLYVSGALRLLSMANIIKIDGLDLGLEDNSSKIRAVYSKDVLNYDKIQKEESWDKYSKGFQPILQYPQGNDYMHPSLKWQKGKLF